MHGVNHRISRAILTAAVILFALAVYEIFTRMDAAWYPLKSYISLVIDEHISLSSAWSHLDMRTFSVPLYMLGCAVLAVWALFARRSRRACAVLFVPCAVMTALGFTMRLTLFGELVKTLKMLPLTALTVLCFLRAVLRPKKPKEPAALPPGHPERHRRSERHGKHHVEAPPPHPAITDGNPARTVDIPAQRPPQYDTVPGDTHARNAR